MRETGDTVIEMTETGGKIETVKIKEVQKGIEEAQGGLDYTSSPYTPKIISIGPLHDNKRVLTPMGDLKRKYVEKLLKPDLKDELQKAINWDEVLGHYDLTRIDSPLGLAKMLVTDGCFLLEFLNKKTNDYLGWTQRQQIDHDILLFENQIPFFVLEKFYHILRKNSFYSDADPNLEKVAYRYLNHMNKVTNNRTFLRDGLINETNEMSEPSKTSETNEVVTKNRTLLHLYHMMLFRKDHQPLFINRTRIVRKWTMALFSWLIVIVSFPFYFIHKFFFADITDPTKLISATEIEEAGVRFEGSGMELRFEEGTLLVPALTLNQQSLRLLKNLIVFEFYFRSHGVAPHVHKYVSFLSSLIKNPEDLKVMEKHHIIRTTGGGDESFSLVHELIQAGFEELMSGQADEIQSGLKTYCEKPHHRWRAKLMKDYFGNPWSIIGVLAGGLLLVIATLQAVFNVLSYYHHR